MLSDFNEPTFISVHVFKYRTSISCTGSLKFTKYAVAKIWNQIANTIRCARLYISCSKF